MRRLLHALVLGLSSYALTANAVADDFPSKQLTLVCGFPPGATADALLRALADGLAKESGQSVIVENRAGAAGAIAAANVARSAADGYTLVQVTNTVIRQPFLSKSSFDPIKDLTYVIGVSTFEFGLMVSTRSPWKTFTEFVDYARSNPGSISYGTLGVASVPHQVMHRLGLAFGIDWTHVPFKGSADAQLAFRAGSLQALSDAVGQAPLVDSGDARILAVYLNKPARRYPDAPTLRQLGVDIALDAPWGIAVPSSVPSSRVARLHELLRKAMRQPAFQKALEQFGAEDGYLTTEDYQRYMAERVNVERQIVEQYKLAP